MYAIYHGPEGLKTIAKRVNHSAHIAARIFEHYGFSLLKNEKDASSFFDTVTVVDCDAKKLTQEFEKSHINISVLSDRTVSLAFNELTKR